jgi:predicted nucleic acid-binding protein
MTPRILLDITIALSDLYESVGAEGGMVSVLIDQEIIPVLNEADPVGLGDRFAKIIDQVRAKVADASGNQDVRNLKEMMKTALQSYVQKTHDAQTARNIFHHAIMSGADTMLTVTASVIMATALAGQNIKTAQHIVQTIAGKLTGEQVAENASGAATGAGAVAVAPGVKKKRRKDSIFAEDLGWRDLQDKPEIMSLLVEIAQSGKDREIDGIMVDPVTAELVSAVHSSFSPKMQKYFVGNSLSEMIELANEMVRTGQISVEFKEC